MALVRRGRTLDCSALTPDETHRAPSEPPKSRLKESANGSMARGVLFVAFISASLTTTLTLTREAFSWKPFGSKRDRDTLPTPMPQKRSSRCLPPADHGDTALSSLHATSLKTPLPTRPQVFRAPCFCGSQRETDPQKVPKAFRRTTN